MVMIRLALFEDGLLKDLNCLMPVPNSFLSSLGGGSSTSPTTPDPGPQFLDSASNHTLVQTPVSSTTFLHCEVEDLRDFQV